MLQSKLSKEYIILLAREFVADDTVIMRAMAK